MRLYGALAARQVLLRRSPVRQAIQPSGQKVDREEMKIRRHP
jgi:hypothetical protein